jgi:hypothetical protein
MLAFFRGPNSRKRLTHGFRDFKGNTGGLHGQEGLQVEVG